LKVSFEKYGVRPKGGWRCLYPRAAAHPASLLSGGRFLCLLYVSSGLESGIVSPMKTLREWWKIEKEKWKHLHIFTKCLLGGTIAFLIYFILTIGYGIIILIFTGHWPVY